MGPESNKEIRTLEQVLDVTNQRIIDASEFFKQTEAEIFEKRYELETAIREEKLEFVCCYCYQPVKIRASQDHKRIFHFAHLMNSQYCPIKNISQLTRAEILALKYHGAKESWKHINLKNFISKVLILNKDNNKGIEFVKTEKVFFEKTSSINFSKNSWKRPDITSRYNGKDIVFELQLSTTFLSVINERQSFYKRNQTYLLWVFNIFEKNDDFRKVMQSDIFYNNNCNAFEIDEIAQQKSIEEQDLVLKCYFKEPCIAENRIEYNWKTQYVRLEDLTFDTENYELFYYNVRVAEDNLKSRIMALKDSELLSLVNFGDYMEIISLLCDGYSVSHHELDELKRLYEELVKPTNFISKDSMPFRVIIAILIIKIDDDKIKRTFVANTRLIKILTSILSLKTKKIIGFNYERMIQVAHSLLTSRPEFLQIYERAINLYYPSLFKEQDPLEKFTKRAKAIKTSGIEQYQYHQIIEIIFPELFKP